LRRKFSSEQGGKPQESFVDFKVDNAVMAEISRKTPQMQLCGVASRFHIGIQHISQAVT
jgi:hypothetical protein